MLAHDLSLRAWIAVSACLLTPTIFARQIYSEKFGSIQSSCPSRTINYITATLPQQCLRTDWSSGQIATAAVGNAARVSDSSAKSITGSAQDAGPVPPISMTTTISVNDSATPSAIPAQDDGEADPLSDNANFLSFEDWKAQMLQKSGQSPEHVAGPKMNQRKESQRNGINNALDGYGEDGEIEIAFGGFPIPDVSAESIPAASSTQDSKVVPSPSQEEKPQKRSKEAGTTSKHRFNYASFDCAATVLKTNAGSKGSTSILSENKDSYMINACSLQNKFIIVELCNDINIDTIVLGNFEFFSSTFRSFRVSVADRYPVKADKWEDIGSFEARNNRGIQAFLVENMRTWARYLRIEFLTHYGAEYYCPVSLLRVHGKTMIDDWKADVKASQGEDDDEDEAEDAGIDKIVAAPITQASQTTADEGQKETSLLSAAPIPEPTPDFSFYDDKCPRMSLPGPLVEQVELLSAHCNHDRKFCHLAKVQRIAYTSAITRDARLPAKSKETGTSVKVERDAKDKPSSLRNPVASSASTASVSSPGKAITSSTAAGKSPQSGKAGSSSSPGKGVTKPTDIPSTARIPTESKPGTAAKSAVQAVASIQPQDSFFRSVHKRLQQLEANSTLSLQYIEEQSRILREAFTKVEKRQLSKTSSFLETLNATVLTELRQFRLQYDQIWQSTVLELSAQREQSQHEVTALSQRLSLLADEILWQRRLAIFQFGLILLCLVLVIFSRNSSGTSTFDVPLLQTMVSKPKFGRYLNPDSPLTSPSRPSSRYGRLARSWQHFRSSSNLDASDEEPQLILKKASSSPLARERGEGGYGLPTPTSEIDDPTATEIGIDTSTEASPEPEDAILRRARSEPTLSMTDSDTEADEEANLVLSEDAGTETETETEMIRDDDNASEVLDFLGP